MEDVPDDLGLDGCGSHAIEAASDHAAALAACRSALRPAQHQAAAFARAQLCLRVFIRHR
jgi:hypothetical protein